MFLLVLQISFVVTIIVLIISVVICLRGYPIYVT